MQPLPQDGLHRIRVLCGQELLPPSFCLRIAHEFIVIFIYTEKHEEVSLFNCVLLLAQSRGFAGVSPSAGALQAEQHLHYWMDWYHTEETRQPAGHQDREHPCTDGAYYQTEGVPLSHLFLFVNFYTMISIHLTSVYYCFPKGSELRNQSEEGDSRASSEGQRGLCELYQGEKTFIDTNSLF